MVGGLLRNISLSEFGARFVAKNKVSHKKQNVLKHIRKAPAFLTSACVSDTKFHVTSWNYTTLRVAQVSRWLFRQETSHNTAVLYICNGRGFCVSLVDFGAYFVAYNILLVLLGKKSVFSPTHSKNTCPPHVCLRVRQHDSRRNLEQYNARISVGLNFLFSPKRSRTTVLYSPK